MSAFSNTNIKALGCNTTCIDLSYDLNEDTIYWPSGESFKLCVTCCGDTPETHYAAGTFEAAEHLGTHVDAPFHFSQTGITVDKIPMSGLIGDCRVIDISAKCLAPGGENYTCSAEDILASERMYGTILPGSIVLIRTGWSKFWTSGSIKYLGYDKKRDGPFTSETPLTFPSLSTESALLLITRQVSGVGLDCASLDPGFSKNFECHRLLLGAGIYGIENVNGNIDLVPETGATLFVMPLKITGGTGSPARVFTLIQNEP